jgi:hypothetical protein
MAQPWMSHDNWKYYDNKTGNPVRQYIGPVVPGSPAAGSIENLIGGDTTGTGQGFRAEAVPGSIVSKTGVTTNGPIGSEDRVQVVTDRTPLPEGALVPQATLGDGSTRFIQGTDNWSGGISKAWQTSLGKAGAELAMQNIYPARTAANTFYSNGNAAIRALIIPTDTEGKVLSTLADRYDKLIPDPNDMSLSTGEVAQKYTALRGLVQDQYDASVAALKDPNHTMGSKEIDDEYKNTVRYGQAIARLNAMIGTLSDSTGAGGIPTSAENDAFQRAMNAGAPTTLRR